MKIYKTLGLLAHVDAGKTTLSESLLYNTKQIRHLGRVDYKNTLLDYNNQERERGITIFSKLFYIEKDNYHISCLDTPGHVDFSGEMERSLSVLDYALLILSTNEKIQSHTKTIWKLLKSYKIPTFIFINKMDASHYSQKELLDSLQELEGHFIPMSSYNLEDFAYCNENMMNAYIENHSIDQSLIKKAFSYRQFFPVYFGSALKNEGVNEFLDSMTTLIHNTPTKDYFSAHLFKIEHQKERLSFLKILSGTLHPKEDINGEKIHQIRCYQGDKYELIEEAHQGEVVCVTGLNNAKVGDILGTNNHHSYSLEPYIHYDLHLPSQGDTHYYLTCLRQLAQEDPLLQLKIQDASHIEISLMGDIQIEILKNLIYNRYHFTIELDHQSMNYKETITQTSEGVGHFEPLRHYAEVHLLLEPLERHSGLKIENHCQTPTPLHYQNLIMKILQSETLTGIINNFPLTDMRISLIGAKHHQKHTEGGDFQEATMRALRHGLMNNESYLLIPYGHYHIECPIDSISKIYYDFENYETPKNIKQNENSVLFEGKAPLSFLYEYTVSLYGKAIHLTILNVTYEESNKNYIFDYQPLLDKDHPIGSIFCKHGAGFYVEWDKVEDYMHIDYLSKQKQSSSPTHNHYKITDEEVKRVYQSIYGKEKHYHQNRETYGMKTSASKSQKTIDLKPELLLIDGYNVIFSDNDMSTIAKNNLANARDKLIDFVINYQSYTNIKTIVVFDAYKIQHPETIEDYANITLVYTKEAETADNYIEKVTKKHAKDYRITVITSDNLEQMIILGHGAYRRSSREFLLEANHLFEQNKQYYKK